MGISTPYPPIFSSAIAGLVPPSGGSGTDFLSADGTFKAAGGGGGGGINLNYETLATPAIANFVKSEYTGMVTTTGNVDTRGIFHKLVSADSLKLSMLQSNVYAPPAYGNDFVIDALIANPISGASQGCGITIEDSDGKVKHWGLNGVDLGSTNWDSPGVFNAGEVYRVAPQWCAFPMWLRLARITATDEFEFSVSTDGATFVLIDSSSVFDFLTPMLSTVGVGIWADNAVSPMASTCYSFELT